MLRDAAELVQCEADALEDAVTVKKDDKMFGRVPLASSQASKNRDALAKSVLSLLALLVQKVQNPTSPRGIQSSAPSLAVAANAASPMSSFCTSKASKLRT